MIIFKTTLYRLTKSKIFWMFTIGIPILFVFALFSLNSINKDSQTKICTIAIIDEDDSLISKALLESLEENYSIRKTNEKEIHPILLEQFADVGIKINKGFEMNLKNGNIPKIELISFSISSYLEMVESSVDNAIDSLRILSLNATDEIFIERLEKFKAENQFLYETITKKDYTLIMMLFGILSFLYLYMGSIVTKPFLEDKISGIKFRNKTMPISISKYNIQSVFAYFIPLFSLSILASLATFFIVKISLASFFALLLSTSVFSLFCVCLSIFIYSIIDNFSAAMGIYSILTTILGMLGGAFWPISFLPDFLKSIANFNPVYWYMRSIEVIQGDFSSYPLSILILVIMSILFLFIPECKKLNIQKN